MKKNILKKLGIMILSTGLIATTAAGCGGCGTKETTDVPATEVLEAVVDTEIPETETEEPETEEAEPTEVEETETEEAAFTVTDMSAIKYAKQTVNVRKGPSADYEKLGSLSANQKVTVTGQADNGWYRIEYNGAEGYVSDKYLTDQMTSSGTSGTSNTGAKKENSAASAPASGSTNASSGSSADTGTPSTGNSSSGNSSADVTTPSTGNSGTGTSTPSADTSNTTTTPDASAGAPSTDAGSTDTSGSSNVENSGAPADNWWELPEYTNAAENWQQGGSDDGSDLGGSSTWY